MADVDYLVIFGLALLIPLLIGAVSAVITVYMKKVGGWLVTTKEGIKTSGIYAIFFVLGMWFLLFHKGIAKMVLGEGSEDVGKLSATILILGFLLVVGVLYSFYKKHKKFFDRLGLSMISFYRKILGDENVHYVTEEVKEEVKETPSGIVFMVGLVFVCIFLLFVVSLI